MQSKYESLKCLDKGTFLGGGWGELPFEHLDYTHSVAALPNRKYEDNQYLTLSGGFC